MAKMIDGMQFDASIKALNDSGVRSENILPITYINSNADVKAKVGQMGGMVCTSSNAKKIITSALIISAVFVQLVNASEIIPSMGLAADPTQFMKELFCPSGINHSSFLASSLRAV